MSRNATAVRELMCVLMCVGTSQHAIQEAAWSFSLDHHGVHGVDVISLVCVCVAMGPKIWQAHTRTHTQRPPRFPSTFRLPVQLLTVYWNAASHGSKIL
jgi:hypothetical protein